VPRATTFSATPQSGEQLFQSHGCIACHRVNNTGGTIGPDLSQEGLRGRTKDWLITQIRNPKAHFPNTVMPAFTALSDKKINDLVDYLLSLKSSAIPSPAQTSNKPAVPKLQAVSPPPNVPSQTTQNTPSPAQSEPRPAADIIGSTDRGALLFKMECASCHGSNGTDKVPNPGSDEGTVPALNPIDKELFSKDPKEFAGDIGKFIQHGSTPEGHNPQLRMPAFGDTNSLTQQQIANAEAYILQLNGVNRAQLENPALPPRRFFFIIVPAVIVILLLLGGIYKCLP